MSNPEQDPSGTTQQFHAFVKRNEAAAEGDTSSSKTGLIVGGVAIALVVLAVAAYFLI